MTGVDEIYGNGPDTSSPAPRCRAAARRCRSRAAIASPAAGSSAAAATRRAWMLGSFQILDDGEPRRSPEGRPLYWRGVFTRAEAEIVPGSWDVTGLRGTGSFDWTVEDVFLPERRTMLACRHPARQPVGRAGRADLPACRCSAGSGRITARSSPASRAPASTR